MQRLRFLRFALGFALAIGLASSSIVSATGEASQCDLLTLGSVDEVRHGGGLNSCGCHFNRKTGECHCHRAPACGC